MCGKNTRKNPNLARGILRIDLVLEISLKGSFLQVSKFENAIRDLYHTSNIKGITHWMQISITTGLKSWVDRHFFLYFLIEKFSILFHGYACYLICTESLQPSFHLLITRPRYYRKYILIRTITTCSRQRGKPKPTSYHEQCAIIIISEPFFVSQN